MKTATITVTAITIVKTRGTDDVFLTTTLMSGTYPFTNNATIKIPVAQNLGEKYAKENFKGVPYKVIDTK